jgi:hypothetical protein
VSEVQKKRGGLRKGAGPKNISGGKGRSPVLRAVVSQEQLAKFHRIGGAEWLRRTLEEAKEV